MLKFYFFYVSGISTQFYVHFKSDFDINIRTEPEVFNIKTKHQNWFPVQLPVWDGSGRRWVLIGCSAAPGSGAGSAAAPTPRQSHRPLRSASSGARAPPAGRRPPGPPAAGPGSGCSAARGAGCRSCSASCRGGEWG